MNAPLAYLNGQYLPAAELTIPASDAGFVQGVTVAEQLRTFGGKLFRFDEHLARLARSLAIVGVEPPLSPRDMQDVAEELVAKNFPLLESGRDLGLSIFVTPGPYSGYPSPERPVPTIGISTNSLAFHLWSKLYDEGQALVTTSVRQVPSECWPAELKCRSRMHYYLADKEARSINPSARALVLDLQDRVSEASTANVVIYRRDEGLVSPPRERILPGISVAVLEELAVNRGLAFVHRDLSVEDVATADEVLLCSTSPCVWPCLSFDGQPVGRGVPGEMARRLLAAWSELVGLDIAEQAARFSVPPA